MKPARKIALIAAIVEALKSGAMSLRQLEDVVPCRRATTSELMRELEAGRLVHAERGKRGPVWLLGPGPDPEPASPEPEPVIVMPVYPATIEVMPDTASAIHVAFQRFIEFGDPAQFAKLPDELHDDAHAGRAAVIEAQIRSTWRAQVATNN